MEKQRISIRHKFCRRFLISLIFFLAITPLFSQTLTLDQVRLLRLVPEESQNLYTKTDIKFTVTIPIVQPTQVQVLSTDQKSDINFRTMRKTEKYGDKGTVLEIWYSFDKKGTFTLTPLSLMIQNRRRTIAFEPVTITDDPSKMNPRIVLVFDNGTTVYSDSEVSDNHLTPLMNIPAGTKISFTVNLQYATQLVKFSWDIPKNSIFTETQEYEFTQVKYRERVYSHDLIPVASFEWTGLKVGQEAFPKFRMNATGYNGYKSELLLPEITINFTKTAEEVDASNSDDIFSDAFYSKSEDYIYTPRSEFTADDCERLAELYSIERHALFSYFRAKQNRMNFEESCGKLPEDSKMFSSFLLYISIFVILAAGLAILISIIKKQKIRLLFFLTILFFALAVFSYFLVKRCEKFGICLGCKVYSIPEKTAAASSEIEAGNKVRILETAGKWVYIELGETGGWCDADFIYIIR